MSLPETVHSLEELAGVGRQRTVSDRSLTLRRDEITSPLVLDTVFADRLALEHVAVDGPLTIRSSRIEELVIDHAEADAVVVTNSRIGRLTVRNASLGCDITVTDTSLVLLDVHSCGEVHLQRLRVEQLAHLAALHGSVRIGGSRVGAFLCRSQVVAGRLGRPRVEIDGLRSVEGVTFDDLWLSRLRLRDVEARALTLKRVRLDDPLDTTDLRCSDAVRINGLVVPAGGSTVADSDIRGPVELRGLERHGSEPHTTAPVELSFRNSTLGRLTAESSGPSVISLSGTSVTGTLGLPAGRSRYRLDETSSVSDLELAGESFHSPEQVTSFLGRAFSEASAVALESVRLALAKRNRNREVDQLYYLTRQTQAAHYPPLGRIAARAVAGGVLGWGVRVRNPARALLACVLTTAIVLHLAGAFRAAGEGVTSAGAVAKALVMAAALWLNVGTGMPSELNSPAWSALAVAFTACGLLFTTLIVGMLIRRLVR